ncbi:formin-like protein 14 [Phyllostomus discolor]|uniref:Formin-like protein 14 n=1 Tax=Phyllostomus discolor TaxID=89673 RepID=A0A7E6DAS9_9CHIR|nr:formin-like protein 14 [Phyllostomus discolor]
MEPVTAPWRPPAGRAALLAASWADAAVSPSLPTPGSWSAGRPQPTEPSAGVTHSRRSASSLCSRAALRRAPRESPRPPAPCGPSSAPGTPPCLPPGLAAGQVRVPPTWGSYRAPASPLPPPLSAPAAVTRCGATPQPRNLVQAN